MTTRAILLAASLGAVGLSACSMGSGSMDRDALVTVPNACAARRFDIYFDEKQDRLTGPALDLVDVDVFAGIQLVVAAPQFALGLATRAQLGLGPDRPGHQRAPGHRERKYRRKQQLAH